MITAFAASSSNTRRNTSFGCNRLVLTALQILIFVTLTSYQLFQLNNLNSSIQYKDVSTSLNGGGKSRLPCRPDVSSRKKNDRANNVAMENSFGACLIVMDDNHLLPEWLAYHYHVLPLRRLIVGIDPRSETFPTEILDRYRINGLMKITEWKEEDFMPPDLISHHEKMKETDDVGLKALYIERQFQFYTRCMAYLKHERVKWTAMTDTDEYILPNPHAEAKFRLQNTTNKTIYELIESNRDIHPMIRSGCISMHRLQFGTKESTPNQVQMMVPPGYNGTDFSTYRWRYHAGYTNKLYNKLAKCMIDVSKISNKFLVPSQVNAHRPSKVLCSENYLRIENRVSPFVGYHYAGSWEQWNFRNDFRPKRLRSNYDLLQFNDTKNQDDSIRPWLNDFVKSTGNTLASELLRDAGHVQPKKAGKNANQII